MCGIYSFLCDNDNLEWCFKNHHVFKEKLKNRGPDYNGEELVDLGDGKKLQMCGHVLWLQGRIPIKQPHCDSNGNILLWNGDIFFGLSLNDESDTDALLNNLSESSKVEHLLNVFSKIKGPWAFLYFQKQTGRLWFGRDIFGRISLLWNLQSNFLIISSIAEKSESDFQEIPAVGIYFVDVNSFGNAKNQIHLYRWSHILDSSIESDDKICLEKEILPSTVLMNINKQILPAFSANFNDFTINYIHYLLQEPFSEVVDTLISLLRKAVRVRIERQPKSCKNCIGNILQYKANMTCHHSKIGILFSGGLDSSIIAALVNDCLPDSEHVDLINVAFEQGKTKSIEKQCFCVPDRITGIEAYNELKTINPNRNWNFVHINVTRERLKHMRQEKISQLIFPLTSVLDDSIGCAIWFAAEASGYIFNSSLNKDCRCSSNYNVTEYRSPARIFLIGMGADEQLAGYTRHRAKFEAGGLAELINEIEFEINRISFRNLGRDNRVVADHGIAPRYPFLDEDVVNFLSNLPMAYKADLTLKRGIGEKLLLRATALKLGLSNVSTFPKRAIQFGSKIAKLEEKKEKGSNICERLLE